MTKDPLASNAEQHVTSHETTKETHEMRKLSNAVIDDNTMDMNEGDSTDAAAPPTVAHQEIQQPPVGQQPRESEVEIQARYVTAPGSTTTSLPVTIQADNEDALQMSN